MSTPIQRFAIEIESMSGRSFDLTDFPLDNGFVYKAVQLFDSRQLAQADIDEDVAAERQAAMENLDDDEEFDEDDIEGGSVTPVMLHQDGQIFDNFGENLAPAIAKQSNLSVEEVTQHVAEYYRDASRKLRKEAHKSDDGLSL
jgi:hypothetical protein